jgi:biotin synthase
MTVLPAGVLAQARARVIGDGRPADRALVSRLCTLPPDEISDLLRLADEVRARNFGDTASVEVLYNAKRGGCSEDCSFCSQSARYAADVDAAPLSSVDEFLAAAREAYARGAGEFCIVVAVRGPSEKLLQRVCRATCAIKAALPLTVAVSLGILTDAQLGALVESGADKVNHNLETSRRFFPSICTTHSYDERWETCWRIKRHGLQLCCGGIVGMGESAADRVDFLMALQELEPDEVPINFLNPRPGTPLGSRPLLDPSDALRFVAAARLALPTALLRIAGGREVTLQTQQDLGMRSGVSGIVLGDYLTTKGRSDADDYAMLDRVGFKVL